ncbi:MAG: hypothetical protein K6T63_03300 [Alicyclobacillus herbarius]|uniref:hypothetical protein n=1 Tax=Alicyclobacillus herbarius TaxID=122960 RepID=UPI002357B775|nr:hypothetical protein [Alicyclobacillus herbarius]MCL6631634.1 hypothetical protein [Alicyclobacillus herbarius]
MTPDSGFSLLEVTAAVTLTALLTNAALFWLVTLGTQCQQALTELESDAAWENAARVLTQDGHASCRVEVTDNCLKLGLVNGNSYSYLVNPSGQLVRVQDGGGTSVLGDHIKSLTPHVQPYGFSITLSMQDGSSRSLRVRILGGLMS